MEYKQRLTIPESGNPYYNTKSNGGYSLAIKGNPTCEGLNVLSNCVGYAYGRFHEIAKDPTMSMLRPVNAELFIDYKDSKLKVGTEPKLGACIVWQRGSTKNGSDGAGHVAIVEQINADGSIITSESGYGYKPHFFTTRRKNDGNWGQDANYTFLGFIYQPELYTMEVPTVSTGTPITFSVTAVKSGTQGEMTKKVQAILKGLGYYTGDIDGDAGPKTVAGIKAFQNARQLTLDGSFGPACWKSFLGV